MSDPQPEAMSRRIVFGIWQQFPMPMLSRHLAQMGWDWIILDLQHGSMSSETAYECIHTIRTAGSRPFVRVPIGAYSEIERFLDLGAQGVILPMVFSPEEATRAAHAAKYPPLGGRSKGGDAQYHYGEDYPDRANRETLLLVQVEHIKAVNSVEEILAVEGVDGCFVGPTDLALSMGLPRTGFESDPRHLAAIQRTLDACRTLGKIAACNTYSLNEAREKARQGYQCITLESDVDLFIGAARGLLAGLRSQVAGIASPPIHESPGQ
jgi:4-hydroxy-2-oxoheptanedioate aldolase